MSTVAPTRHRVVANGVPPARPDPPDSLTDLPSMADIYSLACFSAKFRFLVEVNYASVDESVETPVVPPAIDTCYASLNLTAERLKCAGVDEVALEAVSRAAQLIRDALLSDWLSPGHRERLDARARAEWADDRVASSRLDRFALTDSPFDPAGWTAYESAILSLEGSLDETRRDLFTLGRRLAAIRCPCPSTYDDGRGGLPALDIDLLSRGTAREIAVTIRRLQARTGLLRTVNPWLSPDEMYKSAYELAEAIWDSLEATARQESALSRPPTLAASGIAFPGRPGRPADRRTRPRPTALPAAMGYPKSVKSASRVLRTVPTTKRFRLVQTQVGRGGTGRRIR